VSGGRCEVGISRHELTAADKCRPTRRPDSRQRNRIKEGIFIYSLLLVYVCQMRNTFDSLFYVGGRVTLVSAVEIYSRHRRPTLLADM